MARSSLLVLAFSLSAAGAAWADPPTYTTSDDPASQPTIQDLAPHRRPPFSVGNPYQGDPNQAYPNQNYQGYPSQNFPGPSTQGQQQTYPAHPYPTQAYPMQQRMGFRQRTQRNFGVMAGINIGLIAIDLQVRHFYGYLAAGLGWTLLSNERFGAFSGGAGYTLQLNRGLAADWFMDMLIMGSGGWQDELHPSGFVRYGYGGLGVGLGFRYEHANGFSLGFKIPIFGAAFGGGIHTSSHGIEVFYLSQLASLPIVSLGYRF
jgi:hypothetical protein